MCYLEDMKEIIQCYDYRTANTLRINQEMIINTVSIQMEYEGTSYLNLKHIAIKKIFL